MKPNGRLRRVAEFRSVEAALAPLLAELASAGYHIELSQEGFKALDALHIACADVAKCDYLITLR